MKWVDGECQLSDGITAMVFDLNAVEWWTVISADDDGVIWASYNHATESAAKSAVAAWIGKTIAQLGNALAAGETYPDDGA